MSLHADAGLIIKSDDIEIMTQKTIQQLYISGPKQRTNFLPVTSSKLRYKLAPESRKINCPPNRYRPLRDSWENIVSPIVEHMKLQIRFNQVSRCVEIRTSRFTEDPSALQKSADFVKAFILGFELHDAIALLRLDDLFIDSFEVEDVKLLGVEHHSRAIGRIVGQDGKTKNTIENATKTRIIVADHKVHILGSFANIKIAKDALCSLIMGTPPAKVYNQMRNVARRMNERF